ALDLPQSAGTGSRKEAVPSSWQHHRFLATPWTVAARASSAWSCLMPTSISLFLRGRSLAKGHRVLLVHGKPKPAKEDVQKVPTLKEFALRFLDGYAKGNRPKPSGIASKETVLRVHLAKAFGDKRLDEISTEHVQRLKAALVRRTARRANVKPGIHILRHTFCSRLAMRGAPARAIQELAGHQDLGTTQRYMHLSPAALDAALRLLETGTETSREAVEK